MPSQFNFTAELFPRDFDLSRHRALRRLEVLATCIVPRDGSLTSNPATLSFLRSTLSSITSHVFTEVAIVYREEDFSGLGFTYSRIYREMTSAQSAAEISWHRSLFIAFREMYAMRGFRLLLCADVWGRLREYTVEVLESAVAVEKAAGRLDYLPLEPLVICSPRGFNDLGSFAY